MLATWSPDGSEIAVRTEDRDDGYLGPLVYVMNREGSNVRVLVESFQTREGIQVILAQ